MTDREMLLAMFARAGIEPSDRAACDFGDGPIDTSKVFVNAKDRTGPQQGYGLFWAEFTFDDDGNLISVGAWE